MLPYLLPLNNKTFFIVQNKKYRVTYVSLIVAQKIADEVVLRRFQGEGVEFIKSDVTYPPSDF